MIQAGYPLFARPYVLRRFEDSKHNISLADKQIRK